MTVVVAILGIIIVGTNLLGVKTLIPKIPVTPIPNPTRMPDGRFNIMVADFGELDNIDSGLPRESDQGKALADYVSETLNKELEKPDNAIQHEYVGIVTGTTPETRAQTAELLAKQYNAHIVIYGYLVKDPNGPQIHVRFYVNPEVIQDAEEVAGDNALGTPIDSPQLNSPIDGRVLTETVLPRFTALAQFIQGIAYFSASESMPQKEDRIGLVTSALSSLEQALASNDWKDDQGKEVLYLWLGSTINQMVRLSDVDFEYECPIAINSNTLYQESAWACAESMYKRALFITDNSYARAYLGLGNLAFGYALESNLCSLDLYQGAFEYFRYAINISDKADETAQIKLKGYFDLGQGYTISEINCNLWNSYEFSIENLNMALSIYQEIVSSDGIRHRSTPSSIHRIGVYANYWLGVAYTYNYTGVSDLAIKAFEQANTILDLPALQQAAWRSLRWRIYLQMGNTYFALSEAGDSNHWQDALDAYLKVIQTYEASTHISGSIVAEAYLQAGCASKSLGNNVQAKTYFELAIQIEGADAITVEAAKQKLSLIQNE